MSDKYVYMVTFAHSDNGNVCTRALAFYNKQDALKFADFLGGAVSKIKLFASVDDFNIRLAAKVQQSESRSTAQEGAGKS